MRSEMFDIRTPEEFCLFLAKADPDGKRRGFEWLWPRLTKPARNKFWIYAKRYQVDPTAKLLIDLINQYSSFVSSAPLDVKLKPADVVEVFFPYADPPDLSKKLAEDTEIHHKTRPAVIICSYPTEKLHYFIVAKVTDANHVNTSELDIPLTHEKCGLRKKSDLCLHILTSVNDESIIGLYGTLNVDDQIILKGKWNRYIHPGF